MGDVFSDLYSIISPVTDSIANFAKTGYDPLGEFYSKVLICVAVFIAFRLLVNLAAAKIGIDSSKNKVAINTFVLMIALASAFAIPASILRTMFSLGGFTIIFLIVGVVGYGIYFLHKKISDMSGQNNVLNFIIYIVILLGLIVLKKYAIDWIPDLTQILNKVFGLLIPMMSLMCVFSFISAAGGFLGKASPAGSIERKNSERRWLRGKWRSLKDKMHSGFARNLFSHTKGAKYDFDPKQVIVEIVRGTNDMGRFFTGCDAVVKSGTPLDKVHVDTFEANSKSVEDNLKKLRKETNLLEDNEKKNELLTRTDSYIAFFKDINIRQGISKIRSSKKSKGSSDKFYVLDANSFIWMGNMQNIVIALKDHYSYFFSLYNKYGEYFPKESTFENELAISLNVKSIEEETEKLMVIINESEKSYLKAKQMRHDALDLYKGLESAHPNAFMSYSVKYSMHSHFLDDFLTWIGANGKEYLINENSVGIHENNVIRHGLHKYRSAMRSHMHSLKRGDKSGQFEQELRLMENVSSYVDKLYFILFDLLRLEMKIVKDSELKKTAYFESLQKIISQITNESGMIDDKDFSNTLAPRMQELSRISGELNNIRESRLSVSYEFEYNEERRLLNELLTFLK